MKMKKIAIRCLIALFVLIVFCLFFGKTLETLSTAKARFKRADYGRILQQSTLQAKLHYPNQEDVLIKTAEKYPITIQYIYFDLGSKVAKGDVIFSAKINDYDKKTKEIREDIVKKTQELLDLDSKNAKLPTYSEKNDRYDRLLKANEELTKAKTEEMSKARLENREPDPKVWEEQQKNYDIEEASYKQYSLISSSDFQNELFEYVKKRNEILRSIKEREQEAIDLDYAQNTLSNIKAEKSGIISKMEIKPGESYDGTKPLYSINSDDTPPVLRSIISPVDEFPEKRDRAKLKSEWGTVNLKVQDTGRDKQSRKYIDFELSQDAIDRLGGIKNILGKDKIEISLSRRSREAGTIIPASALRQDGDNYFVYVAEYTNNGILGDYYKVKKLDVKVVGRGEKTIGISEDINDYILDREDRPLKEGIRVLEIKE